MEIVLKLVLRKYCISLVIEVMSPVLCKLTKGEPINVNIKEVLRPLITETVLLIMDDSIQLYNESVLEKNKSNVGSSFTDDRS